MNIRYYLCVIILSCSFNMLANNYTKNDVRRPIAIPYNMTVKGNSFQTDKLANLPDIVYSLSIDGELLISQEDYLVRVLVKGRDGVEHLVMESYKEIHGNVPEQFEDYGEETFLTKGLCLDSIKIYTRGADIHIKGIRFLKENQISGDKTKIEELAKDKRNETIMTNVRRINDYNERHNLLWRADKTWLSQQSYETKKRILGLKDDYCSTRGIEYYAGGIIEIDNLEPIAEPQRTNATYVNNFDWRNRHGKNWMTSIKNQGNSSYCFFFTCVGALEAMANLYYNSKNDLSLSVQELVSCSNVPNPYYNGISSDIMEIPLDYIVNNGLCDSLSYPFIDSPYHTCLSSSITPIEQISTADYAEVDITDENEIKKAIINHGPLISGIRSVVWMNHAMVLVGYGVLQAGDTIYHHLGYDYNTGTYYHDKYLTVEANDPRIGRTYLVYKNSYGLADDDSNLGYMYVIHNNYATSLNRTFYLIPPITSMNYSSQDVVLEDADGDGYYYWGIGSRPTNCPDWVPDEPDGDDSNDSYGPMDGYGNLEQNPCVSTISATIAYTGNQSLSCWLGILSGGVLTISGTMTMNGNSKIKVCNGGTLIVDGGTIQDANLFLAPGSHVILRNNGVINMAAGVTFDASVGAVVDIESGEIN